MPEHCPRIAPAGVAGPVAQMQAAIRGLSCAQAEVCGHVTMARALPRRCASRPAA
ncbi:MAG: hypothetical protein OXM00_01570 [Paracoccaceae bacterium]|nr:hypothetical protein [Paracoccaceae bacterium]